MRCRDRSLLPGPKSPRSASLGPPCPPHTEYQVSTAKSLPLPVPRPLGSLHRGGPRRAQRPHQPSGRTPAGVLPESAGSLGVGQVMEVRGCERQGCAPGSTDFGAHSLQPVGAPTTAEHHEVEAKLYAASRQSGCRTLPVSEEGLSEHPHGHPWGALRRWRAAD